MDIKLICQDKYQYSIPNKVIGLPVTLFALPDQLFIEGNTLFLKKSFHISLVCIGKIIEKYKVSIPDFENKIIDDFCEFTTKNDIKLLEYIDFKFAARDSLKTVIVLCKVSNLQKFFEIINKKYGLKIEYPPTHVTLYAHDGKTGIFLTDANDIKNLTKSIPNPVGRSL